MSELKMNSEGHHHAATELGHQKQLCPCHQGDHFYQNSRHENLIPGHLHCIILGHHIDALSLNHLQYATSQSHLDHQEDLIHPNIISPEVDLQVINATAPGRLQEGSRGLELEESLHLEVHGQTNHHHL